MAHAHGDASGIADYFKRFGREQPEVVVSIEERARQLQQRKAARKAAKAARRSDSSISGDAP